MTSTAFKAGLVRALWTALQAGLGALTVWLSSINVADQPGLAATVVILVGTVLSFLKSFVASQVGDPNTVVFDTATAQ